MKTPVLLAALFVACVGAPSLHAEDAAPPPAAPAKEGGAIAWTEDLEAAKAAAAKEGKDILVDFTGSDWCIWCIRLKKEVFDQPAFAPAAEKFVFVELDFPNRKAQAPELKARNQKLQEAFGVRGFPSVYLLDAKGRPFAKTGYQEGGPAPYLKSLDAMREIRAKRDAAWAKAEGAQGVEKAKLLAEGLMVLDEDLRPQYAEVVAQVKALDPQDATGLVRKEELRAKTAQLQGKMTAALGAKRDLDAAFKVVDDFIAENKLVGEDAQKVAMTKLDVCPAVSMANLDKAAGVLDQVIGLGADTETGKNAAEIKEKVLPAMRKRVEARDKKAAPPKKEEAKEEAK